MENGVITHTTYVSGVPVTVYTDQRREVWLSDLQDMKNWQERVAAAQKEMGELMSDLQYRFGGSRL